MVRIVIADDHPVVLAGLTQLLSQEPDFDIAATAANGDLALDALRNIRPDILLLDLSMPGKDGLAVLRAMKRDAMATPVVVLTAIGGNDAVEAVRLGARGVVLKDMATSALVECIRTVHAGGKWLEQRVATRTVDALLDRVAGITALRTMLTPREMEIARMAANGLPSKAIARTLSITEGTAKLHLHHVYEKLNVRGRVALMQYMQKNDKGG